MKFYFISIWLLSLTISFSYGLMFTDKPEIDKPEIKTPRPAQTKPKKEFSTNNETIKRRISVTRIKPEVDQELNKSLLVELNDDNYYENIASYAELSKQIDLMAPKQIKKALKKLTNKRNSSRKKTMLYSKWAETNPEEALEFAKGRNYEGFQEIVMDVWSQNNPDEAYSWVKDKNNDVSNYAIKAAFKNLAFNNLENALEEITTLPKEGFKEGYALDGIILSAQNAEEYEDIVDSILSSENFNVRKIPIYQYWVYKDPLKVMDKIRNSNNPEIQKLEGYILGCFKRNHPVYFNEWKMNKIANGEKIELFKEDKNE